MGRVRLPDDGQEVDYRLLRHPRSRNVRLSVTADGLRVSAPPRVALGEIERVVRDNAPWVRRQLERFATPAPQPLRHGSLLPLLGGQVRLAVRPGPRDRWSIDADSSRLEVELETPETIEAIEAGVESWYREEARWHLGVLVEGWAPRLGVVPGRLTIRDARTRWGSCSESGGIGLSWRLLMAPPEVGEYVVVHELAHLRQMDHSPAFWAIVAAALPGYREPRAWLTEHGHALSRHPPRRAGARRDDEGRPGMR